LTAADEGISGMRADNRTEFQRMIRMCELKQIDLILTKSVSRFARNVPVSLQYVRKLKALGIAVQFEKEGINTLALGDEMLLNTFNPQESFNSEYFNDLIACILIDNTGKIILRTKVNTEITEGEEDA